MHRCSSVSLLCALLAVASVLTAAPAPFPRTTKPWFDGWDKPVDPEGDCKFDRKGDKLTITVPGGGIPRLDAPRLQRKLRGDFMVQVRVNGNIGTKGGAGIVLMAGNTVVGLMQDEIGFPRWEVEVSGLLVTATGWMPIKAKALRLMRRGNKITGWYSDDSNEWYGAVDGQLDKSTEVTLGVFVKTTPSGTSKATFDAVKLTLLNKRP